jgi:hypothetical protein
MSWWSVRVGPMTCDSTSMPTQEGPRCYQPACPSRSWQGLSDRAEQAPIIVGDHRSDIAPGEHGMLVA